MAKHNHNAPAESNMPVEQVNEISEASTPAPVEVPPTSVHPVLAALAQFGDSAIIAATDDGKTGHYVVAPFPTFDNSPEMVGTFMVGYKYDLLRKLQAVGKKAVKEGKDVPATLAATAASYKPGADAERVETVAMRRAMIAAELLRQRLAEIKQPTDDATIATNLPKYMEKYAAKIDDALRAYLVAGYSPSRKTKGGDASKGVELELNDL